MRKLKDTMVLLTMTTVIVEGLRKPEQPSPPTEAIETEEEVTSPAKDSIEPSLEDPDVGKPISHGQIVDLWRELKETGDSAYSLERLLRGAHVYVPPPAPKPEPVSSVTAILISRIADNQLVCRIQSPYGTPSP